MKPYGDSRPFATTEIPTADSDNTPSRQPSSLPPPTGRIAAFLSHIVPFIKEVTSSVSGTVTNHKVHDTSSPSAPPSRRASKLTVEYHKPSRQTIQEYQELLSKVNLHTAAAADYKDPFEPSRQAPPPPSSHNASRPSGNRQKATFTVPPALPRPSRANATNLADLYADPNPTAVLGTAPKAPLDDLPEISSSTAPVDSAPQQRSAAVASLAKAPDATLRRRENKKIDKANDADNVRRLQQICTNADPTQFYRNLVKIGQGQG